MMDLVTELMETLTRLDAEIVEMRSAGRILSQAESDYRVALASKILDLRADGMPVTITPDLARGDEKVALLKLKRDAAKTEYEATKEKVYTLSLRAKIIDAQLGREWRSA